MRAPGIFAWALVLVCVVMGDALAHEVRPGYLQLREIGDQTYDVLWKVPAKGGKRLGLNVRHPRHCRSNDPRSQFTGDAFLERWRATCEGGLSDGLIHIAGLSGTRTDVLAQFRDGRCKASAQTIAQALQGNFRPEHLFALRQVVALYDAYQRHVTECDQHIEASLAKLRAPEPPEKPLPAPTHKTFQPNALNFNVRTALYAVLGVDLTQIHGIGPALALKLVSECGTDMSKWPTAKHFTSWLCLAPGNKISGGKVPSAHTRRSRNRTTALLRLAAVDVGKTDSAPGRLLPALGRARRQSQGGDRYGAEIGDPLLQYVALRRGLQ